MAKEKIDDWFEMAKELAKAERELKIEHWVNISFVRTDKERNKKCLHVIDLPRHMLERWQWLIDWRKAKYICEHPREIIDTYYCYYDKHSGLEEGYNTLLSRITSAKAQITRTERAMKGYIEDMTQNNMFFNPETDEILIKAKNKLEQKRQKYDELYANLQQQIENRKQN